MACMCGDICCLSCGPAQGNWKCPICRAWASEGCDHLDDETGDPKPEFKAEIEKIYEQERIYESQMRDLDWDREDYATSHDSDLCDHQWEEQPGEPPVDVCPKCGAYRE
jgi:hypothetical protein